MENQSFDKRKRAVQLINKAVDILMPIVMVVLAFIAYTQTKTINDRDKQLEAYEQSQDDIWSTFVDMQIETDLYRVRSEDLSDELEAYRIESNTMITELRTGLEDYKNREEELLIKIDEIKKENEYLTELSISKSEMIYMLSLNDNDMIINKYLPDEVVKLFETYVESISTGNMELYQSILPPMADDNYSEFMMNIGFKSKLGKIYKIKGIKTHEDKEKVERGGYFADLLLEDEEGEYIYIQSIVVNKDYHTQKWQISDFD